MERELTATSLNQYYHGDTVPELESVPVKITKRLVEELDRMVSEGWYASRSEVIRDAVRRLAERRKLDRLESAIEEDIAWSLHGC